MSFPNAGQGRSALFPCTPLQAMRCAQQTAASQATAPPCLSLKMIGAYTSLAAAMRAKALRKQMTKFGEPPCSFAVLVLQLAVRSCQCLAPAICIPKSKEVLSPEAPSEDFLGLWSRAYAHPKIAQSCAGIAHRRTTKIDKTGLWRYHIVQLTLQ